MELGAIGTELDTGRFPIIAGVLLFSQHVLLHQLKCTAYLTLMIKEFQWYCLMTCIPSDSPEDMSGLGLDND